MNTSDLLPNPVPRRRPSRYRKLWIALSIAVPSVLALIAGIVTAVVVISNRPVKTADYEFCVFPYITNDTVLVMELALEDWSFESVQDTARLTAAAADLQALGGAKNLRDFLATGEMLQKKLTGLRELGITSILIFADNGREEDGHIPEFLFMFVCKNPSDELAEQVGAVLCADSTGAGAKNLKIHPSPATPSSVFFFVPLISDENSGLSRAHNNERMLKRMERSRLADRKEFCTGWESQAGMSMKIVANFNDLVPVEIVNALPQPYLDWAINFRSNSKFITLGVDTRKNYLEARSEFTKPEFAEEARDVLENIRMLLLGFLPPSASASNTMDFRKILHSSTVTVEKTDVVWRIDAKTIDAQSSDAEPFSFRDALAFAATALYAQTQAAANVQDGEKIEVEFHDRTGTSSEDVPELEEVGE